MEIYLVKDGAFFNYIATYDGETDKGDRVLLPFMGSILPVCFKSGSLVAV